jgi:hypothetical protein
VPMETVVTMVTGAIVVSSAMVGLYWFIRGGNERLLKRIEKLLSVWGDLYTQSPRNETQFDQWQSKYEKWRGKVLQIIVNEPFADFLDTDEESFNPVHLEMVRAGRRLAKTLSSKAVSLKAEL